MKPTIILSHMWTGVGEQLATITTYLNILDGIKKRHPGKYKIIYGMEVPPDEYDRTLKFVSNENTFLSIADEFHVNGPQQYRRTWLDRCDIEPDHEYRWLIQGLIFIHKDEYTEEIAKEIHGGLLIVDHPIVRFGHAGSSNISEQASIFEPITWYHLYSDRIHKIVDDYIKTNFGDEPFTAIHFRCQGWGNETPEGVTSPMRIKISNYWIDRISEFIDPNKQYFMSSNCIIFCLEMQKRFPFIKWIDRGSVAWDHNQHIGDAPLPDIVPSGLFSPAARTIAISDFIAHIDCLIMGESEHVIHTTCGQENRDMISLFMLYPLMVKQIPVTWIRQAVIINRKYNLAGCYEHSEILKDVPLTYKHPCYTPAGEY